MYKMTIDLELAKFTKKQGKRPPQPEMFPRRQLYTAMQKRGEIDRIAEALGHSSWRTQESHNKQLQMFLDRGKFQQQATWQAEYDRLNAVPNSAVMQPYIDARLLALKDMLTGK